MRARQGLTYTRRMHATSDLLPAAELLHTVQIDLAERSYPILIGAGLLAVAGLQTVPAHAWSLSLTA